MTPEEEMYVIPRGTRRGGSPPEQHPGREPRGEVHEQIDAAHEPVRSQGVHELPAEYSSPRVNNSRIRPISAPAAMNSSAVTRGTTPPCPNASPASR